MSDLKFRADEPVELVRVTPDGDIVIRNVLAKQIAMASLDSSFYRLAVKERDYERQVNARLTAELANARLALETQGRVIDELTTERGAARENQRTLRMRINALEAERADALDYLTVHHDIRSSALTDGIRMLGRRVFDTQAESQRRRYLLAMCEPVAHRRPHEELLHGSKPTWNVEPDGHTDDCPGCAARKELGNA